MTKYSFFLAYFLSSFLPSSFFFSLTPFLPSLSLLSFLYPSVAVFYYCITNYFKNQRLKTKPIYYFTVSVSQESSHRLTRSSVQGLSRLRARCGQSCDSVASSELIQVVGQIRFLVVVVFLLSAGWGHSQSLQAAPRSSQYGTPTAYSRLLQSQQENLSNLF